MASLSLTTNNIPASNSQTSNGAVYAETVTALDAYGNPTTVSVGTVSATSSDPNISVSLTSSGGGVYNFNVAFNTGGSQSLYFTNGTYNTSTAVSQRL